MDAKHTPGAIRAAEILVRDHWKRVHPRNRPTLIDGLATMIDRETAAPDLLEACRIAAHRLTEPDPHARADAITLLRDAIANATKETT